MRYVSIEQEEEQASTDKIIQLVAYIASQSPQKVNHFLVRYGYQPTNDVKKLETNALQMIIENAEKEEVLIGFLKMHPDKSLIIENYKNGNIKACSCGCDECDGEHDVFYRQGWFISGIVLLLLLGGIYCIVKNT